MVEWLERLLLKRYTRVQFPVGSNEILQKVMFTAFMLDVQHLKGQCKASMRSEVDRWADGSLP